MNNIDCKSAIIAKIVDAHKRDADIGSCNTSYTNHLRFYNDGEISEVNNTEDTIQILEKALPYDIITSDDKKKYGIDYAPFIYTDAFTFRDFMDMPLCALYSLKSIREELIIKHSGIEQSVVKHTKVKVISSHYDCDELKKVCECYGSISSFIVVCKEVPKTIAFADFNNFKDATNIVTTYNGKFEAYFLDGIELTNFESWKGLDAINN